LTDLESIVAKLDFVRCKINVGVSLIFDAFVAAGTAALIQKQTGGLNLR
jgi:hypothetical protein